MVAEGFYHDFFGLVELVDDQAVLELASRKYCDRNGALTMETPVFSGPALALLGAFRFQWGAAVLDLLAAIRMLFAGFWMLISGFFDTQDVGEAQQRKKPST